MRKQSLIDRLFIWGLDAPYVVRNLIFVGCFLAFFGLLLPVFFPTLDGFWYNSIRVYFFFNSMLTLSIALGMTWSSARGKVFFCKNFIDQLELPPGAEILELGCGHGMYLFYLAQRFLDSSVSGVDIWNQNDQLNNSLDRTLHRISQFFTSDPVQNRIKLFTADMRDLPFSENQFQMVISSLGLHNLPDRQERERSLQETMRVLKPGGQIYLIDFCKTKEYQEILLKLDFQDVRISKTSFWIIPPVRIVSGRKTTG